MKFKRMLTMLLALLTLCGLAAPACAEVVSRTPLLTPTAVEYIETPDDFLNVLLLGIEQGFEDYRQSDWTNKPTIRECHADVVMVMSFNKTKRTISLVSIPRDTLVYVPGIYGFYKVNAAFNLADSNEEGFEKTKETVSWLLGGVRIDAFCAVDMQGMITLGDAMGGLDFEVDMSYTGSSDTNYYAGQKYLDGLGIMDYCRARTNATIDPDDLGRTRRCRSIVIAIIEKLRYDQGLVRDLWSLSQSGEITFFTDVTLDQLLTMWTAIQTYDETIGSYGFTGYYGDGGLDWYFNFTNQSDRQDLLKTVYGISAEPLPYVSRNFTLWMRNNGGFLTSHNIRQAKLILDYAKTCENPTAAMKNALDQLETAYDTTVTAFDKAGETLEEMDRLRMMNARNEMQSLGDTVARLFQYPEPYSWNRAEEWDKDPLINDYYLLNWR